MHVKLNSGPQVKWSLKFYLSNRTTKFHTSSFTFVAFTRQSRVPLLQSPVHYEHLYCSNLIIGSTFTSHLIITSTSTSGT